MRSNMEMMFQNLNVQKILGTRQKSTEKKDSTRAQRVSNGGRVERLVAYSEENFPVAEAPSTRSKEKRPPEDKKPEEKRTEFNQIYVKHVKQKSAREEEKGGKIKGEFLPFPMPVAEPVLEPRPSKKAKKTQCELSFAKFEEFKGEFERKLGEVDEKYTDGDLFDFFALLCRAEKLREANY